MRQMWLRLLALERLQVPTLAIWGELDNNTMPEKDMPSERMRGVIDIARRWRALRL